jgi:hypothetical protein
MRIHLIETSTRIWRSVLLFMQVQTLEGTAEEVYPEGLTNTLGEGMAMSAARGANFSYA